MAMRETRLPSLQPAPQISAVALLPLSCLLPFRRHLSHHTESTLYIVWVLQRPTHAVAIPHKFVACSFVPTYLTSQPPISLSSILTGGLGHQADSQDDKKDRPSSTVPRRTGDEPHNLHTFDKFRFLV